MLKGFLLTAGKDWIGEASLYHSQQQRFVNLTGRAAAMHNQGFDAHSQQVKEQVYGSQTQFMPRNHSKQAQDVFKGPFSAFSGKMNLIT